MCVRFQDDDVYSQNVANFVEIQSESCAPEAGEDSSNDVTSDAITTADLGEDFHTQNEVSIVSMELECVSNIVQTKI